MADLSSEQLEYVHRVAALWADGLTQEQVANKLGRSLSTVRSRLRYYGYKFGRNGRLIRIYAPEIDAEHAA